jgi:hypothetical protein
MKTKRLWFLLVTVLGVWLGAFPAWAQGDLAKSLVGKWEGELQLAGGATGDPNRTLIIESVTQKDGTWVAAGRFGITGQGLGKVEIEVTDSSGRPFIRFVTGASSTVRLSLTGARELTGATTFSGASNTGRGNDRALRLEKKD